MAWVILFLAVVLSFLDPPKQSDKYYFEKYSIENLTVVFMDRRVINTWWRLVGGQKDWEKVHAFTYYDPKKNMYYIILPPNADKSLIGYEFNHILEWKRKKLDNRSPDKTTNQITAINQPTKQPTTNRQPTN